VDTSLDTVGAAMPAGAEESRSVLARAFSLLQAFSAERTVLSLAELAGYANLPKSTAHRIAATLVGCGALERHGDVGYCVGSRLHDVGLLAPSRARIRSAASPFLHELHELTRATVHLGIWSANGALYLDKVSRYRAPWLPTRPGSSLPAHSTALGKCLLAFSAGIQLDGFMRRLKRFTPRTITQPQALTRELTAIVERGAARDREETIPGISCVGAPIVDRLGVCVAAISVSAPTSQLRSQGIEAAVVRMANHIARGYDYPAAERAIAPAAFA
jgi:DNA-binding IclR family transcriptional regulator